MTDFNGNEDLKKMLDDVFGELAGSQMDMYAKQLYTVYTSFEKAGFTPDHAVSFVGLMFADDLKRVRDKYEDGGSRGTGFSL